jgi:uncharacterized protein (TIGR02996 family)
MARAAWFGFEAADKVTPEEAQFRRLLDDEPHDAVTRLIFADWLDEHGRADDALTQRLLGTRAVLVRDSRPGYLTSGEYAWDLFLAAGDPLFDLLDGSFTHRRGQIAEWCGHDPHENSPYLAPVKARGYDPFCRHCYPSPAEAEVDLLRAYKALLQREAAG